MNAGTSNHSEATLKLLLSSLNEEDDDAVREAADNLRTWIENHGFLPDLAGLDKGETEQLLYRFADLNIQDTLQPTHDGRSLIRRLTITGTPRPLTYHTLSGATQQAIYRFKIKR